MRNRVVALAVVGVVLWGRAWAGAAEGEWSLNVTNIEACSCPMFCQCYFNDAPGAPPKGAEVKGHAEHHKFCRFNMAQKVNHGRYGTVVLDGVKFWVSGDLGEHFEMKWGFLTFDPAVTKEQREAISELFGKTFGAKWKKSAVVAKDAPISWEVTTAHADAKLDDGKAAEIHLVNNVDANTPKAPTVITNLKYFNAPRNDGFLLMPSQLEAYRLSSNAFEYKGTNGFVVTYDINSGDFAAPASPTTN